MKKLSRKQKILILLTVFTSAIAHGADQVRVFSTDRPDKTESPYTVPAGRFQIETDIVTFAPDKYQDAGIETRTKSLGIMVSNIKAGLTDSVDLQVIIAPYQHMTTEITDTPEEIKKGFGDTIVRLKYNLFGNDSGPVSMGVMPFIKLPTHAGGLGNKKYEGGILLPVALALPHQWKMGLMAQVNRNQNEFNEQFHNEFISTMTIGHAIIGNLAGYLEFFSQSSEEAGSSWIATVDTGFTYAMTPDLQLDMGANFGATRAADDFNPFLGVSVRF